MCRRSRPAARPDRWAGRSAGPGRRSPTRHRHAPVVPAGGQAGRSRHRRACRAPGAGPGVRRSSLAGGAGLQGLADPFCGGMVSRARRLTRDQQTEVPERRDRRGAVGRGENVDDGLRVDPGTGGAGDLRQFRAEGGEAGVEFGDARGSMMPELALPGAGRAVEGGQEERERDGESEDEDGDGRPIGRQPGAHAVLASRRTLRRADVVARPGRRHASSHSFVAARMIVEPAENGQTGRAGECRAGTRRRGPRAGTVGRQGRPAV